MAFNMKKHQHGNYGPDDLDGYTIYEKERALELYNQKYAGKMVTIYYNPDNIDEFYVKEIEEELMLRNFKDMKNTSEYRFFIKRFKDIILVCAIVCATILLMTITCRIVLEIVLRLVINNL